MHIESLEASNFRNLESYRIELSPEVVIVRGPNANGKTNLLEALYVSATGRSFRNATSRQLLAHGLEAGRIRSHFVRQNVRHEIEVRLTPKHRSIRVDERGLKRASKLLELVNVVAFFPDDLRIIKGSPEERRRFLDRTVANYEPQFVDSAIAYSKILKNRNALLKSSGALDPIMLETFDEQLISHGYRIHRSRIETLEALSSSVVSRYSQIMGSSPELELFLETGLKDGGGCTINEYAEAFRAELKASYRRDRARGTTSVGPHRSDLKVAIDGQDARTFASQGQQRSLVLALKLAEATHIGVKLDCSPILLLDDVSSELDADRTGYLFEAIAEMRSQVWVSTTGAAHLPIDSKTQVIEIRNGALSS